MSTNTGSPFNFTLPQDTDLADFVNVFLKPQLTALNTYALHSTATQVLVNKSIADATDNSKTLGFNLAGTAAGLSTTLVASATGTSKTITLPNLTDTLVGRTTTDTLTNKTLTSPSITSPSITSPTISSGGLIVSAGNVGIGTTSPVAELHVKSSGYGGIYVERRSDAATVSGALWFETSTSGNPYIRASAGDLQIYTGASINVSAGTERLRLTAAGNLGIGTSSPGYQLTLSTDSAAKPTSNTWTISSDARVKEVIGSYTRGVADIMALEPKRYRLNGAFGSVDDGRVHVSVIAQEARETWPEMIGTYEHTNKDEDDVETVTELLNLNTNELQWALVNAIKELAQRLEALEVHG